VLGIAIVGLKLLDDQLRARDRARRKAARKARQREYRQYLHSEGWQARRAAAIARSCGFCEDCGIRTNLDVHHITYARKGAERPEDLRALCRNCHKERHHGKRSLPDVIALAILRWWRIRRYRRAVQATQ
jgi:5-methylcytosine-specific restriction endonuclease McrA